MKDNNFNTDNKEENLKPIFDFGLSLIQKEIQPILLDYNTKLTYAGKKWGHLKSNLQTEEEFKDYFLSCITEIAFKQKMIIGAVGGKVSKGLICIDFDNKGKNAENKLNDFLNIPFIASLHTLKPFLIEKTKSGGFHVWIRLNITEKLDEDLVNNLLRTKKYAYTKLVDDNTGEITNDKTALIETKAEGGYAIFYLNHKDFFDPPTFGAEEIKEILKIAESFDEFNSFTKTIKEFTTPPDEEINGNLPGDIFNTLTTTADEIKELLKSSGYTYSHNTVNGNFYTRPNKDVKQGISCCYNGNTLYNWSSNDPYFENNKAYKNFTIYTYLKHNKDFTEAAKEISLRKEIREQLTIREKIKESTTTLKVDGYNKLTTDETLNDTDKKILISLIINASPQKRYKGNILEERGEITAGRKTISTLTNINESTVKDSLKRLRDKGFLDMKEIKKHEIYKYEIKDFDRYVL